MKKRYLYLLLFCVPAVLVSVAISLLLLGAAAGFSWIFVFGDNPWPPSAGRTLVGLFVASCLALWGSFMFAAFIVGKNQEVHATVNVNHVMIAIGITAVMVFLFIFHQWRVGNVGSKSSIEMCSGYCQDRGFAGSGMPPRDTGALTCSCFDGKGREAMKVPMAEVLGGSRR